MVSGDWDEGQLPFLSVDEEEMVKTQIVDLTLGYVSKIGHRVRVFCNLIWKYTLLFRRWVIRLKNA